MEMLILDLMTCADVIVEWRLLTTHLSLTVVDEHDILAINNPALQRREALRRWKRSYGAHATYGALLKVFLKGQCTRGAQKVVEVISTGPSDSVERLQHSRIDIGNIVQIVKDTPEYTILKTFEEKLIDELEEITSDLLSLTQKAVKLNLLPRNIEEIIKSLDSSIPHQIVCKFLFFNFYTTLQSARESRSRVKLYNKWIKLLSGFFNAPNLLLTIKETYASITEAVAERLTSEKLLKISENDTPILKLLEEDIPTLVDLISKQPYKWEQIAQQLDISEKYIHSIHEHDRPVVCLKSVLEAVQVRYGMVKLEVLEKILSGAKVSPLITHAPQVIECYQLLNINVIEDNFVLLGTLQDEGDWFHKDVLLNESCITSRFRGTSESILSFQVKNILAEGSYKCQMKQPDGKISWSDAVVVKVMTPVDCYKSVLTDFYTEQPEIPKDTWPPVGSDTFISLALVKGKNIHSAGKYGRCTIKGDIDDIYRDKEGILYDAVFNDLKSASHLLVEGRPGSGKTTLVHKVSKDWATEKIEFQHNRLLFLIHLRAFSSDPSIRLHDLIRCYYGVNSSESVDVIARYAEKHNGLGLCFILDGLDEYLPPNKTNTFIFKLIKKQVLPKATVIVASRPSAAADFRQNASKIVEVIGFLKEQIHDYIERYPFSQSNKAEELHLYLDQHPNIHHMCYLPIHTAMVCFLFDNADTAELPQTETEIYNEFTKFTILRYLYRCKDEDDITIINSMDDLPLPQRQLYIKICRLAFEMTNFSKQVMKQSEIASIIALHDERESLGLVTLDRMAAKCGFQNMYTFIHLTFQEFLGACFIASQNQKEQMDFITRHGGDKNMQQVWKFFCGLVKFDEGKLFRALTSNFDYGSLYNIQCSFESQQSHTCDIVSEERVLTFANVFLSESNFTEIAYVISNTLHNYIEKLWFEGCTFDEEGIDILVSKAGDNLVHLKSLCYHNCNREQLRMVRYLLQSLPHLEILDISNTIIEGNGIQLLTDNLSHANLRILKVGSQIFSRDFEELLIDTFKSKCCNFVNVCFCSADDPFSPSSSCFHYNITPDMISYSELSLEKVRALSSDLLINKFYTKITLINNSLDDEAAGFLSRGLRHCPNLEVLELPFNAIGHAGAMKIAASVKLCTKLRIFDASFNAVDDEAAIALATVLSDTKLFLTVNNISRFEDIIGINDNVEFHTLKLVDRHLGNNDLARLTSAVDLHHSTQSQYEDILQVFLDENRISATGINSLSNLLMKCGNLLKLSLSFNGIGDHGAVLLGDALSHCTKLHVLDVSSNNICSDGARAVARGIEHCPFLLELRINCNSIGNYGATVLAESLKHCSILQELGVHSNNIGSEGANSLLIAVKSWNNFCVLDISNNPIGVDGMQSPFLHSGSLKSQRIFLNISALDFSTAQLLEGGALILGKAIKWCKKLHILNVSNNNFGTEGTIAISEGLKNCHFLYQLKFNYNNSGNEGIKSLMKVLKNSTNLQVLEISSNLIGNEGATAVVNAMKHWTKLLTLDLSRNPIGMDGIKFLPSILSQCSGINTFNISDTLLRGNCVQLLTNSFQYCKSLKHFVSDFNEISNDDIEPLTGILQHCSDIEDLSLSGNNVDGLGWLPLCLGIKQYCPHLYSLDISGNSIGNFGVRLLDVILGNCPHLSELNLSNNAIAGSSIKRSSSAQESTSRLRKLDLSKNQLGHGGATELFPCLTRCKNLNALLISNNFLRDKGVLKFTTNIFPNLSILDVSGNHISNEGMLAITANNFPKLSRLDASSNQISNHGAVVLSRAFETDVITNLNLSDNQIGLEGAEALVQGLWHCTRISVLDVSNNPLGAEGIQVVKTLEKFLHHYIQINV